MSADDVLAVIGHMGLPPDAKDILLEQLAGTFHVISIFHPQSLADAMQVRGAPFPLRDVPYVYMSRAAIARSMSPCTHHELAITDIDMQRGTAIHQPFARLSRRNASRPRARASQRTTILPPPPPRRLRRDARETWCVRRRASTPVTFV